MNLTTRGLEPDPAGVPTAPMRAPQATASMRARPKRLSPGFAPSSVRIASARGMIMALEAMAVTHIERKAPAARKPKIMRRVELPVIESTRRETRFPRPERTMAAARAKTPIKKSTTSSPKPLFTIVAKSPAPTRASMTMARSPVIWNGSASSTHMTSAPARTAMARWPFGSRRASPARRTESGRGRNASTAKRMAAMPMAASLRAAEFLFIVATSGAGAGG